MVGIVISAKLYAGFKKAAAATQAASKGLKAMKTSYELYKKTNAITTKGNIIKKIATAVQWAYNAAMSANPVAMIIIGVMALIGVVVLLFSNLSKNGVLVND